MVAVDIRPLVPSRLGFCPLAVVALGLRSPTLARRQLASLPQPGPCAPLLSTQHRETLGLRLCRVTYKIHAWGRQTLFPASPARTGGSEIVAIGKEQAEGDGREVALCQVLGRALCFARLRQVGSWRWAGCFQCVCSSAPGLRTCLLGKSRAVARPTWVRPREGLFPPCPMVTLAPPPPGPQRLPSAARALSLPRVQCGF